MTKIINETEIKDNKIGFIVGTIITIFILLTDLITWGLKTTVKQIQMIREVYKEKKIERITIKMAKAGHSIKDIDDEVAAIRNADGIWTIIKKKSKFFRRIEKIAKFLWKHLNKAVGAFLILGVLAKIGQAILPALLLL